MALLITATAVDVVDGSDIPAAELSITGLSTASTYSVQRSDGAYVRGADSVPVLGDAITHSDWEFPLEQSFSWTVRRYDSGGVLLETAVSNTISWTVAEFAPAQKFFIKSLDLPTSVDCTLGDWSDTDYDPRILGEYMVLGRPNPVIFTSAWGARAGTFTVQACELPWAYTSHTEILNILKTGEVLLLQNAINSEEITDMYFMVKSVSRHQYGTLRSGNLDFTIEVSFQEVDRPPTRGLQIGYGRWQDLYDDPAYVTYADVLADNATWLEVLQRYSSVV